MPSKSESEYFVTSDGQKIPINLDHMRFFEKTQGLYLKKPEEIHDFILSTSTNISGSFDNLDQGRLDGLDEKISNVSLRNYTARYMNTWFGLDLLSHTNLPRRYGKGLDIGCGFGIQPRIMRGAGLLEEAVGIDLFDRSSQITSDNIRRLHRRMRRFRHIEGWLKRIDEKPIANRSDFERAVLEKFTSPRQLAKHSSGYYPPPSFYDVKFRQEPKLDRFIKGDVFELNEKFDFITAFSSMEWFDSAKIFPKIAELLNVGGAFYMYVGSWWAGNIGRMPPLFPYPHQRLPRDDYERYVETYFPDRKKEIMSAYGFYDPQRPTLSDYLARGIENNLVPVRFRRDVIPDAFQAKRGILPVGYASHDINSFRSVAADAQRHRPDVGYEDLMSNLVRVLFVRVDDAKSLDADTLEKAGKQTVFSYRPNGLIMKTARKLALRTILRK